MPTAGRYPSNLTVEEYVYKSDNDFNTHYFT